jgi:hypothetical protein
MRDRALVALTFCCIVSANTLAANTLAAPITLGPACGLEWEAVNDARVEGYRFYVNGKRTQERKNPKLSTIKCDAAGAIAGLNKVYLTAFGAGQESKPSNTVEFNFDPSELAGPSGLKWKIILEVSAE